MCLHRRILKDNTQCFDIIIIIFIIIIIISSSINKHVLISLYWLCFFCLGSPANSKQKFNYTILYCIVTILPKDTSTCNPGDLN